MTAPRPRQRKKQKFGDLQSAVDELAQKVEQIKVLEKGMQEAEAKLMQQQKVIDEQKRRLETLPAIMMRAAAAAAVKLQQRPPLPALAPSSQQACGLQAAMAAEASSTSSPSATAPAQHSAAGAVRERLLTALRAALSDVCEEQGWSSSSEVQQQVIDRFAKSLGKELSSISFGLSAANLSVVSTEDAASPTAPGRKLSQDGGSSSYPPLPAPVPGVAQLIPVGVTVRKTSNVPVPCC